MSAEQKSLGDEAIRLGKQAKAAARELASLSAEEKNRALRLMAERLETRCDFLVKENEKDLEGARKASISNAVLDRIALDSDRVRAMARGLRDVAALPDPVHEIV